MSLHDLVPAHDTLEKAKGCGHSKQWQSVARKEKEIALQCAEDL